MDYIKIEVVRVAAVLYISLLFTVVDAKEGFSFLSNQQQVVVQGAQRIAVSSPDNGHRPSYFGEPGEDIDLDAQVAQLHVNDNQQKLFDQVNVLLSALQARIDTQLALTHDHLSDIKDTLGKLNQLVAHNGQLLERGHSDAVAHYKNTHTVAQNQIALLTALQKKLEDQIPYQKESLEYQKNSAKQVCEVKELLVSFKGALADIVDLMKQQQQERQAALAVRTDEPTKIASFFAQLDGYRPYAVSALLAGVVGLKVSVSTYLYALLNDVHSWSLFSTLPQATIQGIDTKKLAQTLYDAACKKYAGTLDNFSQGTIKARLLIDIAQEIKYLHTWQTWYSRFGVLARLCMPACVGCDERIRRLEYYQDICIQEWKDL